MKWVSPEQRWKIIEFVSLIKEVGLTNAIRVATKRGPTVQERSAQGCAALCHLRCG
jgi:hypothetical protein